MADNIDVVTYSGLGRFKSQADALYGKVKSIQGLSPDNNGNVNIPEATNDKSGLMSSTDKDTISNLKSVATSGSYNDLSNKPTKLSEFENDITIGIGKLDFSISDWTNNNSIYTLSKTIGTAKFINLYRELNGNYQVICADDIVIASATLTITSPEPFNGFILVSSTEAFDESSVEELESVINNSISNLSQDIIPIQSSTISLGSTTNKFKSIYADEVHISQNTLYIGDTPVLCTDEDTINIKADPDQSVLVKTTGTGTTQMSSENGILLRTNGTTANININADGTNSEVTMNAKTRVSIDAPSIVIDGATTIKNLTVSGTITTVNSTNLAIKDNLIELNSGETGNGVTAGTAGIKVNRGDELPYLIQFDEADDRFKVGKQGSLETIATQDYVDEKVANSAYSHPTGIVTAGNYNNVTVNAEGHVIAGTRLRLMQTFCGYSQLGFDENPADIHALIAAMPINSTFTKSYSTSYSQYSLPEWGTLTITKLDNRCDLELNAIDIGGSTFKYIRTANYNLTTNTLSDWSDVNKCNIATYTEYKQLGFSEAPASLEELILAIPANSVFIRRISSSSVTLGCPSSGILTITKAGSADTAFITLARENGPAAEHKRFYVLDWYKDMPADKYEWRENAYLKDGAVEIDQGGTGATTASEACANIGALPLSGGTMTGNLTVPKIILSSGIEIY